MGPAEVCPARARGCSPSPEFVRIFRTVVLLFGTALFVSWFGTGCGRREESASATEGSAIDLNGGSVNPLTNGARANVLFFVAVDCPISNRLMPQMQRINEQFTNSGVAFWMVYPDQTSSSDSVTKHLQAFDCSAPALLDRHHVLTRLAGARVTPEAAVFDSQRRLVYRGRINNQFVDFGQTRPRATEQDLENALHALLEGKPITNAVTTAVGCYISSLR